MANQLTKQDLNYLTESGFTLEQAEAIVKTIEQRAITIKDLELLRKDLKLWTVGVVFSGFFIFTGVIGYLDTKTHTRLDSIESRFNERFNKIDERFNRIEADIKTLLLLNSPNSDRIKKAPSTK